MEATFKLFKAVILEKEAAQQQNSRLTIESL